MKKTLFAIASFIAFALCGCATLQKDILISAEDTASTEDILELEEQLYNLDGKFILYGNKLTKEDSDSAELLKKRIEDKLDQPHLDKVVESRLTALKGRTALMLGKKSEASKCCSMAEKKYANDAQLIVLKRRLGILDSDIDEYKAKMGSEFFIIEDAISHYEKGEYDISAGLFDSVFVNPKSQFIAPYSKLKEKAWSLRNSNESSFTDNEITLLQMVQIAKNNKGTLDFYTAGKEYDGKKLYKVLENAGVLKSVSGTSLPVNEKAKLTRNIAARFLWNIHTQRNSLNATKYSSKYRSRENAKSPVTDIDLDNPDFDAILGVVENEIMKLADGKNFKPESTVSAAEMDRFIKKIK